MVITIVFIFFIKCHTFRLLFVYFVIIFVTMLRKKTELCDIETIFNIPWGTNKVILVLVFVFRGTCWCGGGFYGMLNPFGTQPCTIPIQSLLDKEAKTLSELFCGKRSRHDYGDRDICKQDQRSCNYFFTRTGTSYRSWHNFDPPFRRMTTAHMI